MNPLLQFCYSCTVHVCKRVLLLSHLTFIVYQANNMLLIDTYINIQRNRMMTTTTSTTTMTTTKRGEYVLHRFKQRQQGNKMY